MSDLFGSHPAWSAAPKKTATVQRFCCGRWEQWEIKDNPHQLVHALCHGRQPFTARDLKLKIHGLNDLLAHRLLKRTVDVKWAYAIRFDNSGAIIQVQGRL